MEEDERETRTRGMMGDGGGELRPNQLPKHGGASRFRKLIWSVTLAIRRGSKRSTTQLL